MPYVKGRAAPSRIRADACHRSMPLTRTRSDTHCSLGECELLAQTISSRNKCLTLVLVVCCTIVYCLFVCILDLTEQSRIQVFNQDFTTVDPNDEQYAQVRFALVDPSCSGSGIQTRQDALLGMRLPRLPGACVVDPLLMRSHRATRDAVRRRP